MPISLRIWDEVIPGQRASAQALTVERARMTARDLIASRVRQEVERYNQSLPEVFYGLVQPEESEQILNGFRLKTKRPLDWEVQFQRACSSFERNGFLLLVDGQQVGELDDSIDLKTDSEVQFVKLVPLVGG
jgi:hypothetical protein